MCDLIALTVSYFSYNTSMLISETLENTMYFFFSQVLAIVFGIPTQLKKDKVLRM